MISLQDCRGAKVVADDVVERRFYIVSTALAKKPDYPVGVTRYDLVFFNEGMCVGFRDKQGTAKRNLTPSDFEGIWEHVAQ